MKSTFVLAALSAALTLGPVPGARADNLLANPGFEAGNLTGWGPFGANNSVLSGASAHSGSFFYKVYGQFSGSYNLTGIYQITNSAPGAVYSADGWANSLSSDAIHGSDQAWLEVSFRDASYKALALYRSPVVTSSTIAGLGGFSTWIDLQVTNQCSFTNSAALILLPGTVASAASSLVAPAGTAFVLTAAVYSQGSDNANGSIYFDDITLTQTGGTTVTPPALQWNIVWNDEFNGSTVDPSKWAFETGNNGGWGNSELEYYTSSSQNATVANGNLSINALQQSMGGFNYTSARMKTQNRFNMTYGRVEWRAALPSGTGMWPALWMLGSNFPSVGWPSCGEIDVVEANGSTLNRIQSSLHSGSDETGYYYFGAGDSITNFHTYVLDWEPYSSFKFYADGNLYETQTGWWDAAGPYPTPFNAPEFLIMNLAVGGNYVGNPTTNSINAGTVFPASMIVDYVRVYQLTAPLAITPSFAGAQLSLTWPTNIVCRLQSMTNSAGLNGGVWTDVPGATNPFNVLPDPSTSAVFYRLVSP